MVNIFSFLHNKILRLILPDWLYLSIKFRHVVGYWPNLKRPKSFNEKLNWLKLNDIHSEYTQMVDKVTAKEYVKLKLQNDDCIIKTIGIWNSVEEIDWDSLPQSFVIKATNDSGGVVVCKDKSHLNIEAAKKKLQGLGGRDYTKYNKEYPYHNVPHRFIAEEYMQDESGFELKDYKIFCSYGKPLFLFVATGRQKGDTRFDFFDIEFKHIPVLNGHLNADVTPQKPKNFEMMLQIASKLSEDIPQVRIDLYNCDGRVYFGEMTFFHWSGLKKFEPEEWDYKFGDMITLPYER